MRAPGFWWRKRRSPLAQLLSPFGWIYGRVAAMRMAQTGKTAAAKVVCIGNFTVGGAGKTPVAVAVALELLRQNRHVVFLSRGYGGREHGPLRADPERHGAIDIGDEPLLLARYAPVIIARDRVAGAALCVAEGAEIIVMDDGLQNSSLHKDLSIVVIDTALGTGNGACLPAGPLRAPLRLQWPLVDALILMGNGTNAVDEAAAAAPRPVFRARLETSPELAAPWIGGRVLAYSGIARPEKFFRHLDRLGIEVVRSKSFPDHHDFSAAEAAELIEIAVEDRLALVTTEKDFVRLKGRQEQALIALAEASTAIPVEAIFEDAGALAELLRAKL